MKGKIIGGVAAMSMALATFVSFGITASATDYTASALYNNYANNKPNVLQNGDRIKQDGGTTNVVVTKYPSILFLTHKYANGNTYKAEFKTNDGSYATVGSGNSRYRYWKVTYSKKERIQYVRDDYYITLTANDPSYKAPTAKSLTYNGQAQELANAATSVSGGTVKYSTNNSSWGTAVPKETAAGTYTVYYKVDGSTNYNSIPSTSFKVTINKAASTLTAAPAAKELTWTGEAQELVNAGTATGGTVQYKLGNGSYSTAIPTAADAGTYTVYYKVVGDANHNDIAEKSVKVTINKADASFTTEPVAQSLTWTGEAQELVTAGTANGGEVQYSLDNINWSTAIPTATAVDTYTVYYKISGDAAHNDTAVKSVTATIGAKAAEATYKNVNNIGGDEYDGEASAWTVTVTPGSTAITSVDVKVNDIGSDGQWNNTTAISGGPINFGVVVKAAADKVKSMTAVVNSIDVPATLAE